MSLAERRIPTLIGLLIITVGIFGTSLMVQNLRSIISRAKPSEEPSEIKVTNVSHNTFTVSWITQSSVPGSLLFFAKENEELTALDEKDESLGSIGAYTTHHVILHSLKPSTSYFFTINSASSSFNDSGKPYRVTTAGEITQPPSRTLQLEGTVINEDGTEPKDLLIFATLKDVQPLSIRATEKGSFTFNLPARTLDLRNYYEVRGDETVDLLITNGLKKSNVRAKIESKTIPTIVLGENYDFIRATPSSLRRPSKLFPTSSPKGAKVVGPTIVIPKSGERFTDARPRFSGTAPKGATIRIVIESPQPIEVTVKADSNGNWSYRPTTPLTTGQHTITIVAKDSSGVSRTQTLRFEVFAQSQPVATPSPTPTKALTPTPPPGPSDVPPAGGPTLVPTQTPIPTKAPAPLPVSGETLPLILVGAFGVITFIVGLALLL